MSADAAAVGAAHHALVALFPSQAAALNAARAASLAARGLSTSDPGVAFGASIAAEIVALRANDGSAEAQFTYAPPTSGTAGGWTPFGTAPALLPGWGRVVPWVLRSGSRMQIPLFPTPPHPEFLSGHATNSSAMAAVLKAVFGDKPGVPIVASSSTNPGFERRWQAFSEGVAEVIDARVYSGIHFRATDEVSADVGREIAKLVIIRQLRRR